MKVGAKKMMTCLSKVDPLIEKLNFDPKNVSVQNTRFNKTRMVRKWNGKTKSRDIIRSNKKPRDNYKLLS